jgi:hypothetical protein
MDPVQRGKPYLSSLITETIPLHADLINQVMDRMDAYQHEGRVVILPS